LSVCAGAGGTGADVDAREGASCSILAACRLQDTSMSGCKLSSQLSGPDSFIPADKPTLIASCSAKLSQGWSRPFARCRDSHMRCCTQDVRRRLDARRMKAATRSVWAQHPRGDYVPASTGRSKTCGRMSVDSEGASRTSCCATSSGARETRTQAGDYAAAFLIIESRQ
jgi:hypothetical protein